MDLGDYVGVAIHNYHGQPIAALYGRLARYTKTGVAIELENGAIFLADTADVFPAYPPLRGWVALFAIVCLIGTVAFVLS